MGGRPRAPASHGWHGAVAVDFLTSELAGIGLPWRQRRAWGPLRGQHRLDAGLASRLVGGAAARAGVFLFPVYLSHAAASVAFLPA